jgi:hypothetical protein
VWRAATPGRGLATQKPLALGRKKVPGPSPNGVGVPAAAKVGLCTDEGAASAARPAGGGTTGGQWKVTALGSLRGCSTWGSAACSAAGSRQCLRWLVKMVSTQVVNVFFQFM